MQEVQDIFNDPKTATGSDRHKLLSILTDGAPTSSWKPVTAEYEKSLYYAQTLITSFESGVSPNYSAGLVLGSSGNKMMITNSLTINNQKISSHLTTTISTAYQLKKAGFDIHSLTVKIISETNGHSKDELL